MGILESVYKEIRFFGNMVNPFWITRTTYVSKKTGRIVFGLDGKDSWNQHGFSSRGEWEDYKDYVGKQLENQRGYRPARSMKELLSTYPLEQFRQTRLKTQ